MNNNEFRDFFRSIVFLAAFFAVFSFISLFAVSADAASTIGTNIVTTGTLKVQNTASASYFLTGNTIQVGGFASAAYNRFGTAATTHAGSITTSNDLLISGDLEVDASAAFDGKAYFGSTASIAGVLELANGQIRPQSDGTSAFKLQNAAATYSVLTVDSTNLMASVSRLITGGVASASLTAYSAQFNSAATSSVLFGTSSTNKGTCLQMKDTTGANVYVRINGSSFVINSISCR